MRTVRTGKAPQVQPPEGSQWQQQNRGIKEAGECTLLTHSQIMHIMLNGLLG